MSRADWDIERGIVEVGSVLELVCGTALKAWIGRAMAIHEGIVGVRIAVVVVRARPSVVAVAAFRV